MASFLSLRPYNASELRSFELTYKGSNHSSDHALHDQCDRDAIRAFFRPQTRQLARRLEKRRTPTFKIAKIFGPKMRKKNP